MNSINSLQVFVLVARLKSFSKAAEISGLSRPSVTRLITQLEEKLQTRLFHRSTRSVSLTTYGEELFERVQKFLLDAEAILTPPTHDQQCLEGNLRISCSGSSARFFLLEIINKFLRLQPGVNINLFVMEGAVDILQERIDIAFQSAGSVHPGYVARKIGTCFNVLCASPLYLEKNGYPQTPQDLTLHRTILNPYFNQLWQFQKHGKCVEVAVNGNFYCNNASISLDATLKDMGISILPSYAVKKYIQNGRLIKLLPDWKIDDFDITAITDTRHLSILVRTFLDFVKTELQALNAIKEEEPPII